MAGRRPWGALLRESVFAEQVRRLLGYGVWPLPTGRPVGEQTTCARQPVAHRVGVRLKTDLARRFQNDTQRRSRRFLTGRTFKGFERSRCCS